MWPITKLNPALLSDENAALPSFASGSFMESQFAAGKPPVMATCSVPTARQLIFG